MSCFRKKSSLAIVYSTTGNKNELIDVEEYVHPCSVLREASEKYLDSVYPGKSSRIHNLASKHHQVKIPGHLWASTPTRLEASDWSSLHRSLLQKVNINLKMTLRQHIGRRANTAVRSSIKYHTTVRGSCINFSIRNTYYKLGKSPTSTRVQNV